MAKQQWGQNNLTLTSKGNFNNVLIVFIIVYSCGVHVSTFTTAHAKKINN